MADVTIFHNPRCTTSRAAMASAAQLGIAVDEVRYLDHHPTEATLRDVIAKLEDPPAALVRPGDRVACGVDAADVATVDGVVRVLLAHPQLMQRPVLVRGDRAIIGRPGERVAEFLAGN